MKIQFEEVALKATRKWTDSDGRKRQETKKFFQTISPFNKNAAGERKSRDEILSELIIERDEWLAPLTKLAKER